ncbi:hypothetical protein J3F84DRAFT_363982 [Trichoderma pleuroticola]
MCVRQQKIPVVMLTLEQLSYRTVPYRTGTAVDRLRPGSQYRCSRVLARRANALGGRRLCPRFADHTGRLTSFNILRT